MAEQPHAAGSEQDLTAEHEDQPSAKVQDSCGEEENKTEEVTANESTELKKESTSNDSETSVVKDKTEDKDQQETEENKQSVADDIPDGSELTDEDRQDISVSVAESDRESLLDKVDLFDTDTKEEEELREVQRNILEDQTTKVDISIDSLDHNGNEATGEKEGVDFDETVPNGDTVEKFVEGSPEINTQASGLESQNEGSSVDDCKEVNEFFLTETVTKVSEEDQKENSASDSGDQEDEGCRRQVNETEEKQTRVEDLQTTDAKSFSLDSLERDSNIVEEGTYTIRSDVSETLTNVTASLEDIEMPEKQDPETLSPSPRGDGVLSPSLQRANFRYRWAKTVRTESNYVVFFSTYKMEEPIKLTWSEACECYYSQEYDIPTGVYRGNLVIDGQTYPVEDLTIKHYTFEADLYVKEDLAEDEAIPKQTTDATISVDVDTQGSSVDPPERFGANLRDSVDIGDVDGGIHKSSKYEELVKKQLSQSNSLESDMNRSNLDKPEYEISGRRSPIGDVATEPFQDGGDSMMYRESLGDRPLSRGSLGERPMSKGDLNISVVEDEVERPSSVHSNRFSGQGSGRQTPGSVGRITPQISNDVDEFFTSERREPVRSSHSSARQTPQQADFVLSSGRLSSDPIRDADYTSPVRSHSGSVRQTPTDLKDTVDDILGNDVSKSPARSMEGSRHSSARQTPSANVVGDILGQTSPALIGRTEGSAPVTPPVHSTSLMSPPITSDLVRGSQEKVYGSRPQSLTSEQELTQYFENGNRHGSTHGSLPASLHGSERSESRRSASVHASPAVQNTDRPLSSSSLPVITTQQRLMAEKRSMTPDNHIRVPGDVPAARMLTPRSNVSSRASDRTITPGIQENGFNEDAQSQRILDLEDSVRNLRKLLSSREAEVHELNKELKHLKELNQSLTEELDRTKERPSSRAGLVELERKYTQVLNEKEILATEVVKLRDEVEELRRGRPGELEGDLGDTSSCGISSYNPNNPYALQRRISDLQSQIQDLQEANESAVSELSGAERRIEELTRENETLRDGQQHGNVSELKAENRQLHDQISRLYEQGYGGGMTSIREDDNRIKIEFQQVKDDNKALKERNYKLHEENIRLKEEMVNTRTGADMGNIRTGVERSSYADTRLTQSSSLYSESRLHQTEPLLDKRMSQPRRSSQDYAGDRLSATDRYQVEKSYTSPLKGSYEKEVEVRASSTLKKPADYYLTDKSADHQFRSSLDRYKSMRSTESDVKLKQSADREDVRLKHTLTRDDSGFKLRSMDNAESRIRSALEKADANLRSVDKDRYCYDSNLRDNLKDESKYRYDDKLSSYSRTLDSPRIERNYERKVNESERSRSELYRSMPDGGASDKESQSSRERYDRSKSSERRIFGTLDMDSERLRYDKERRAPSTERDYMTADPAFEWSRNKGIKEKSKEWSRSEADLRYARGRSRTPDRYFLERKRSVSPPEHKSSRNDVYTARRHRDYPTFPNSARSSTRYRWDDEAPARHTISNLQDRVPSDLPPYSKTTPGLSVYRPKGEYNDFGKGYDLYKRPSPSTYQDDTGDVSDTATDILVNAEPYEKQPVSPVPDNRLHRRHGSQRSTSQLSRSRRRHDSLDSSGSMSDVEDIDDQLYGKHSRSKSADGRELIRRSQPLGTDRSGLSTGGQGQTMYKTLPTPSTANLRTVTPSVLTTQHNRNMLASSTGSLTSLTTGMRPFAPRSPADISIEDVVKFSRQGGKLSQGRVKFVGHLPGRSDAYLGVELDKEDGKHDGKFEGMRYFRCKPSKGVFVAFNKVVMAWAP